MGLSYLHCVALCLSVLGTHCRSPKANHSEIHQKPPVRTIGTDGFQFTTGGNVGAWMLRIMENSKFACGGAYYSELYVLTSANCMYHYKRNLELLSVEFVTPEAGVTNAYALIETVIVPDQYEWPSNYMDIAVLKLVNPIPGGNAEYVKLCNRPLRENMKLTVVACGAAADEDLRTSQISVSSKSLCMRDYSKLRLAETVVCTKEHNPSKDCIYDPGCPVTSKDELCGIVAWGPECSDLKLPGLFTDIYQVKTFIKKAIGEHKQKKIHSRTRAHRKKLRTYGRK